MTADIQGDQELEDEGVGWVDSGKVAEKAGSSASKRMKREYVYVHRPSII
jgi:hypothetical protein